MNRRSFLGVMGSTALAGLAGGAGPLNACSRAGLAGNRRLGPLGLQLYTVRGEMQRDLPGTLARIAQIGYREVEFAGYFGRSADEIRALLNETRLVAPAGHFGLQEFEERLGETLAFARGVGHEYVVLPWLTRDQRASIDNYRRLATAMNGFARAARDAGLQFAYHNHEFEFAPLGGAVPYDVLLAETDPDLVKLELDIYWIVNAGRDPLEYFARESGRFPLVHVKDSAGPPQHAMVSVGRGAIDWSHVLGAREQAGIRHFFVEHDNPPDPFASITESYTYLSQLQLKEPHDRS